MTTFTLSCPKMTVRFVGFYADALKAAKNMDFCYECVEGVEVKHGQLTLATVICGTIEKTFPGL